MSIHVRPYVHDSDFEAVGRFLIRLYRTDPPSQWLQPRWRYTFSHPVLDRANLDRFSIWEEDGDIVALVHYESRMGVNYVQLDPRYPRLRREMLQYATDNLVGELKAGRGCYVYIDDADTEFGIIAAELGYTPKPEHAEPMARFIVPDPFPGVVVPDGFRLQSLADEFDVAKVHRVMHRGFNHDGEPPQDELEDRRRKISVADFRRDLTIVAVAPDGNYVSYAGMWPVPESTACYIEPVATDPDYRRLGLGRACVLESIRRCAREGATVAYVGSDQPFYLSMGFEVCGNWTAWWRPTQRERSTGTG